MSKDPDRDYNIAIAMLDGVSTGDLAEQYNLRPERIRAIARENAQIIRLQDGRPVPNGLPVRTAVAIENAIGIWPTVEDAREIDERRIDILRSHSGRRVIMQEIDKWLAVVLAGTR
ncbi:hypothetical protein [Neorhizobium alkalisoli]|uniref:hypothetical protein n=1 Tax=Neorhizobium alkalisoli TaxID=528178 RepID=UPI0011A17C16|nr:hypothetical protein [Neorhizobium alkalisoli]